MGKPPNILLVDDDATVRQSLAQALSLEQFGVFPAASSQEALAQLDLHAIDAVLLDLNLGEESGWETLAALKKLRPDLPIILMTGYPEQKERPEKSQAEAFMEKPLDLELLFQKLRDFAAHTALVQPDTPAKPPRGGARRSQWP